MNKLIKKVQEWWGKVVLIFYKIDRVEEKKEQDVIPKVKKPRYWKNLDHFLLTVNKIRKQLNLDYRSLEDSDNLVSFFMAKKLGPYIVPDDIQSHILAEHTPYANEIPMFGFVTTAGQTHAKITKSQFPGRFAAFMRTDCPPVNWEMQTDDEVCVLLNASFEIDRVNKKHAIVWEAAYVGLHKETGYIRPLKKRINSKIKLPGARGAYVPTRQWMYPDWANDHFSSVERIQVIASHTFSAWSVAEMLWQVEISDGETPIVACIEVAEAIELFKDRDRKELTKNGRKKAICHFVRAHERQTKSKTTVVRLHTRGAREFTWHGLNVTIRLPGKHGHSIGEVKISSVGLAGVPRLLRRLIYGRHPYDGKFIEDTPHIKYMDDSETADFLQAIRADKPWKGSEA